MRSNSLVAGSISLLLALAATARAQQTSGTQDEGATPAGAGAGQEVIITGSRIGRTGFNAPSPVTVIGQDYFEQLGITNVGAGVSQLPAFRASNNPSTNGFGSFNVGAQIVNLRGLGVTRNLILVDGRRFAPTTREGSVDLNLIPSLLVERTEVVTGGASAAYGSDAVAGVVNVILDKDLTGLRSQFDYGVTEEGDGDNWHVALAGGTSFLDGRGHVVIGGEYDKQQGIGNCFERDWCTPGAVVTNNAFNTPPGVGNGLPNFVRNHEQAGYWMTTGGVVAGNNAPAIRNLFGTGGIQFADDGTPMPYTPGQLVSGTTQVGGQVVPTYLYSNLMVPVERYTLFGHANLELSDNLQGFLEASYGYVSGSVLQTPFFDTAITISRDNPFIPAAIREVLDANPDIASFTMGRLGEDLGRGFSTSTADVYRITTGLEGSLGTRWSWDAYYQFARTDRLQTVENNRIQGDPGKSVNDPTNPANFARAVDAVIDNETEITPETGDIVCRATLSSDPALRAAAAGCRPLNLFGVRNWSQEARDYVYGTLVEDIEIRQHVVAANVRGDAAELWAGPLAVAAGLEFRRDEIEVVHDPLSNLFAYFQNFGADYDGTAKVVEGYVETELPLLRERPLARSLSLNVAGRHTQYDLEGFGSYLRTATNNDIDATTWKASLVWDPTDWLRVRATRSRDIRAPNFAELYLASASSFAPALNRFTGTTQFPRLVSGGSPDLEAEKANTTTLGIVFQPSWGWSEGLRLSVDFYDIEVDGYIASPGGAQFIIDRCFAGNERACGLITFGPDQSLLEVRNVSLNLDRLSTRGADIEADYRLPLSRIFESSPAELQFRVLGTYVDESITETFGIAVDRAGQTGGLTTPGVPEWLVNAFVTYAHGPASVTLQARFIDSGIMDATRIGPDDPAYAPTLPNSINDNRVSGRTYINLYGSYDFSLPNTEGLQLFASVSNLFDENPPLAPETQYPTNPTYFDQIGRTYRLGLRVSF